MVKEPRDFEVMSDPVLPCFSSALNFLSHVHKCNKPLQVSNCHFCRPPRCASLVGACLEAILTSAVFMYSCAAEAHTFLCALVSAFLQSREQ